MLQRDPVLLDAAGADARHLRVLLDPKETDPARRARLVEELARILPGRDRFRVSTDRDDDLSRFRAAGFGTWRTIKNSAQLARAVAGDRLPDVGVSLRHTLPTRPRCTALHGSPTPS